MTSAPEPDGVFLEGNLPLSWQAASGFDAAQLERWMHANAALLRALAVLDSSVPETEREPNTPTGKALERLETKTDLTLALVIQLLGQQTVLPAACHTILRGNSVEWLAHQTPPAGNAAISVYLSAKLPLPLVLPAQITSAENTPAGIRVRARLVSLDEEVQDWLERTLFRHHRRAVQKMHGNQAG